MSIALVMALFALLEREPASRPVVMRILLRLQTQSLGSRVGNLMRLERLMAASGLLDTEKRLGDLADDMDTQK